MKAKISSLISELITITSVHKENVALWFSAGADSRLLLEVMTRQRMKFGILTFDDGFTRRQKAVLGRVLEKKPHLSLYAYPARTHLLIGKYKNLALVSYYQVSRSLALPVVRDLVEGKRCAFDLDLKTSSVDFPQIEFDAHIRGSRFEDKHWSLKTVLPAENSNFGGKNFYHPLANWTREEVLEALEEYGVSYQDPPETEDTGNISVCSKCFQGKKVICPKSGASIAPHEWNRAANLKFFRSGKAQTKKQKLKTLKT